jgi:hypothetical protein
MAISAGQWQCRRRENDGVSAVINVVISNVSSMCAMSICRINVEWRNQYQRKSIWHGNGVAENNESVMAK